MIVLEGALVIVLEASGCERRANGFFFSCIAGPVRDIVGQLLEF